MHQWLTQFKPRPVDSPLLVHCPSDPVGHFTHYAKGRGTTAITPFAVWALRVLKAALTTAFTESRFSTLNAYKSCHRGNLKDEALLVPFVMRGTPPLDEVSFPSLLSRLQQSNRSLFKGNLTGRRKKRKQKPSRPYQAHTRAHTRPHSLTHTLLL